jgi:D-ribulokinase
MHFIGIDVGTGSARAGVFDTGGQMLGSAKHDIALWREAGSIVEQSSADIWSAVCAAVRGAMTEAGVDPASVGGIGVDATCSLVVVGEGGVPLPVGPSEDPARDIIVWMDHRAVEQAERINATGASVLSYVGGVISPEMETPKLLWLRENRPEVFDAAWGFFDLADWLTWRLSGSLARSSCTVTCKWTYLAHEHRWDANYFRAIGLDALADEGFTRIGTEVVDPGACLGGLTSDAASALGLTPGTPVAAGLIDAHAGGIGTVGALGDPTGSMGYVFGTSSCTMTTTCEPVFVPGVWGPYFSAMVPGMWLSEGGQSAAGAAIDRLVHLHPAAPGLTTQAEGEGRSLLGLLSGEAARSAGPDGVAALAHGIHVVPEFLGNRAPFADPHARAVIAGLGMETDAASLVALYVAGLCGIGYGLRQILKAQASRGAAVERVMLSGGAGQSDLVRQLLADASGKPVVTVTAPEPVLLGAAILGAVAGGAHADIPAAMAAMSAPARTFTPDAATAPLHTARFAAFERLQATAREIRSVESNP